MCALLLVGAVSAWAAGTTANTTVKYESTVSSKDAGTKKRPKAVKLGIDVTGDTVDGMGQPATSTKLIITLAKGFRINSKRWPRRSRCSQDAANRAKSDSVCPRGSRAGRGRANVDGADGAISRTLNVKTYVLSDGSLGFFLRSASGEVPVVSQMLRGKVSGRRISVAIPTNVQEPVQGVPTGIRKLKASISAKARIKGKRRGLIETVGCSRKKWKFTFTDIFRDGRKSTSFTLRCRK